MRLRFTIQFRNPQSPVHAPRAMQTALKGQKVVEASKIVPAADAGGVDWQEYNSRWSEIWDGGLQKGQLFDKGVCSPQLLNLISSGALPVKGKHVLVPGCGRGYDVFAFAAAGAASAVGLDICPVAIAAAKEQQQQTLADHPAAASAVHLCSDDFFTYGSSSSFPFDVGYDYTFLCALHPEMRRPWAAAWSSILAAGGELVTMVYPVDPTRDQQQGPPWAVTPELYKELLVPAGFELVSLERVPDHLSHEGRQGREWLGRWINRKSPSPSSAAAAAAAAGGTQ